MIESFLDLNQLRIIAAITMLGYASYTDVTKREISDFVWIVFGALSVALLFLEPQFWEALTSVGISLIVAPIVLIIWRLGMFGGADAFGLIVLALLVPQITMSENTITPFTILTNAVIISIFPFFVNLVRNLIAIARNKDIFEGFSETRKKRIIALFIGYKAKNPKYCFSIEKKVGKHKKLNLVMHHAEYAEFCEKPNTWVTPGIPYMLFITAGFIVQLLYGDIIFNALGLTV
jgi:archaeal preflagellin peptidase FlaK